MLPPLPPEVLQTILGHLLPPAPPLPAALVSRSLLDRLTYLPPEADDIDPQLSPLPPPGLGERLAEIAREYHPSPVTYASDGEVALARCLVRSLGVGGEVAVLFEYEQGHEGHEGRGWVYRSTGDVDGAVGEWVDDPDKVVIVSAGAGAGTGDGQGDADAVKPEDYWAGFTPPTPAVEVLAADAEADDYWAQYDQAVTPATAVTPANRSQVPSRRVSGFGLSLTPAPHLNGHHKAMEILASLSVSSPPALIENDVDPMSDSERLLRDKLAATISSILRRAWSDFTRGAEHQGEMEHKALQWIHIGRTVVSGNGRNDPQGDTDQTTQAKLQVLEEMHRVLVGGGKQAEESFWRLIEDAMRSPRIGDGADRTQLGYWE